MLLNARPIRRVGGPPDEIFFAIEDITERETAEKSLCELNAELERRDIERTQEIRLLSEAVKHLGEGVLVTDNDLNWPGPRIQFVNEALCQITGYSAAELIGNSPRVLQGKATLTETRARIREELSAGRSC